MKPRLTTLAPLAALGVALLAGCSIGHDEPAAPAITFGTDGQPSLLPASQAAPATQLQVKVLTPGDGPRVEEGQEVQVLYTGWLWPSGVLFDSAYQRGTPITFPLARGTLIDGWVDGLVGQRVGSTVEIVIPPDKAYGSQAVGGVPANSTLVFVVDILSAAAPSAAATAAATP